jgi:hypothetical protein
VTALDDRPAVSAHDMAAGHFKLSRVLLGIISNPTLAQPMSWSQNVWHSRTNLDGHFYDDGATLDARRTQIAAYAAEFGLTVTERAAGNDIRIKAEGTWEGVEISIWGLAPAGNDGAA